MTTQLRLYNRALRMIGERQLASLSEDREPRRVLDDIWDDDFIDSCLEEGFWNFAMRAIKVNYSTVVTPAFGYTYAFEKPTDWIRTAGVSADEFFNQPLTQYMDEVGYLLANIDPLYVRYISNDSSYGNDLTRWPASFKKFAAADLAFEAALRLLGGSAKKTKELFVLRENYLMKARNKDAMNEAAAFPPQGGWVSSRYGRRSGRNDRGNRGSLIG